MLSKKLEQELGDGALGVQAGGDVSITLGPSVEQIRAIASMAFRDDFFRMLDIAGTMAEARAQKILDQYLERIQAEHPQALRYANEPDFRYALYSAQKAAARSGDANLQDVLVELLVDRSKQEQRSLTQLVLNEAIEVVPRITTGQMNALTLAVVFHRIAFPGVSTIENFFKSMDVFLAPFLDNLATSFGSINHLVFAGCGVSGMHNTGMADTISRQYPGIFSFGFSDADVRIKGLGAAARSMLVPCDHNPALVQVMGGTKTIFEDICNQKSIPKQDRDILEGVFLGSPLPHATIRKKCLAARPYFVKVFEAWDGADLMTFIPSNVGLAIAHARLSKCGYMDPLSSWIE